MRGVSNIFSMVILSFNNVINLCKFNRMCLIIAIVAAVNVEFGHYKDMVQC